MKSLITLLLLVGCATTEPEIKPSEPHFAKWCLENDPTNNCTYEKSFLEAKQCLLFIVDAPKKDNKGYWVCQLDPTRSW